MIPTALLKFTHVLERCNASNSSLREEDRPLLHEEVTSPAMLDGPNVVCCRMHNSVSRYEKRHGCTSLRNIRQPPCKVQLMVNVCAHVPVTNVYTDQFIQDSDKIFNLSLTVWPFRWPRSLRHGSATARLLGLWIRIPPGGHGCIL